MRGDLLRKKVALSRRAEARRGLSRAGRGKGKRRFPFSGKEVTPGGRIGLNEAEDLPEIREGRVNASAAPDIHLRERPAAVRED